MRRFLIGLAAAAFVLAPLGSAHAQDPRLRDPFDPLLSAEDATTTSPTEPGETPPDPVTGTDPDTEPDVATQGLPTTGQDSRRWLAAAYVLVAAGAMLVALSRLSGDPRRS